MAKFHINKHGVPAPCKATEGNCPYGGESGNDNHFNTLEDAQSFVDEQGAEEHGALAGMNNIEDVSSDESVNDVASEPDKPSPTMQTANLPPIDEVIDDNSSNQATEADYNFVVGKEILSNVRSRRESNGFEYFKHNSYQLEDINGKNKRWVNQSELDNLQETGKVVTNGEARKAYQYLAGKESFKTPEKVRVKIQVLGSELKQSTDPYSDFPEEKFNIIDLEGKKRTIDSDKYYNLKYANMTADNERDAHMNKNDGINRSRTNKFKMIDVKTEFYNNSHEVDSEMLFRMMDSNGDAKWLDREEFGDLKENDLIATKEEIFDFPLEVNEKKAERRVDRPKKRSSFMNRVRGLFSAR